MKKNDYKNYLVQLSIIEARCLKSHDSSGLANPFVKVRCGKLPIQTTQVVTEKLEANWNQSFTFDGLRLTEQELQTTDLIIEVYSKNRFLSNDLIGMYSIGLSTLYKNANHEFYNMWMVLYNQDEDPEEAQGYLLIDAFIVGPGDRPPVHDRNEKVNQDVAEEDEDINIDEMTFDQLRAYQEKMQSYQIIGKPNVARKGFQLSCYVFKAESLLTFNGSKPNAFVSARVAGLVRRTKAVSNNFSPLFNQKMQFPCYFPFLNDKILLRIWSANGNSKDIFIANIPEKQKTNNYFNLSKLISMGGRMPAKWVNLYGIPDEERNKPLSTKIIHPDEGTAFLGRVLLSFSLIPKEFPVCATLPTNPFYEQEPDIYTLYCDIYQLKYLKPEEYNIVVWCDCRIGSYGTGKNKQKKPNKKGTVKWEYSEDYNEIILPAITNIYYPKEYEQVPDIFINLYTGLGGNKEVKRLGYIRLKAELVNQWTEDATPRWLHFNSLDKNKNSPGCVLVNLQFLPSCESKKRKFKQIGIEKKFQLFAHIVNGFELCPKENIKETELITKIKVEINDVDSSTKEKAGRYPVWNEILKITANLDWKLDFAPDVAVICYKKTAKGMFGNKVLEDEEIGRFTVPVVSIKKLKKYPHYFNLINKGEIVGRVMALFFITDSRNKSKSEYKFCQIQKILEKVRKADIKIFTLGIRNLDYIVDINKIKYNIDLTIEDITYKAIEEKNDLELNKINNPEYQSNFLNIVDSNEYKDVEIRGDTSFQIYPFIKLSLINEGLFYKDEKFLIFNLNEFASNISEHTKKLYRILFEQNLGINSLRQEQQIIPTSVISDDLINLDDDNEGEDNENQRLYESIEDNYDVMDIINKKKKKKEEIEQQIVDIKFYDTNEDKKLSRQIKNYKNMSIGEYFGLECKPSDKRKEREIMKSLRKSFYKELKYLRKIPNPTIYERNRLLDLEEKFRDAKKPQMNEAMFFGFEDISDEYNYGREIYKEDVYEEHPNLIIPYKKRELFHIPRNPLENSFETLDGYYKLGRMTDNYIKFNVKVEFYDGQKDQEIEEEAYLANQPPKIKMGIFDVGAEKKLMEADKLEIEIEKEAKDYDIFNKTYQKKLRYLYLTKEEKNLNKEDNLKLPLNNLRVRVYIYRCLNLAAQDNFFGLYDLLAGFNAYSEASAYFTIQVGDDPDNNDSNGVKFVNTKDQFNTCSLSPEFYQFYELEADLPRDWKLSINVYSHTKVGKDSLIGSTFIDLEDRYLGEFRTRSLMKYKSYESDLLKKLRYLEDEEINKNEATLTHLNKKLANLNRKIEDLKEFEVPVEYRELLKPDTKTAQGIIEMFVEILPQSRAKIIRPAKIERPPPEEYEIRLVIWETRDLPYEKGRRTLDAMITVSYDPEGYSGETVKKQTDVHLGCKDGRAIFNWRMKFNLKLPCTFPRLTFDVRDFNVLSSDEALCTCTISIKRLIKKLLKEGKLEIKNKWIQLSNRDDPGEPKGEIKIDLYFLQKFEADQNRVGEAQDEPNHSPKLIKPKEGRGVSDFLKGTLLDFTGWKFNFSLFGSLQVLLIVVIVVILIVILFVQPGILVK